MVHFAARTYWWFGKSQNWNSSIKLKNILRNRFQMIEWWLIDESILTYQVFHLRHTVIMRFLNIYLYLTPFWETALFLTSLNHLLTIALIFSQGRVSVWWAERDRTIFPIQPYLHFRNTLPHTNPDLHSLASVIQLAAVKTYLSIWNLQFNSPFNSLLLLTI